MLAGMDSLSSELSPGQHGGLCWQGFALQWSLLSLLCSAQRSATFASSILFIGFFNEQSALLESLGGIDFSSLEE